MKNDSFRITSLPRDLVERIRTTLRDDLGNTLHVRRDDARHQCRSCLRLTEPGEGFIALSHRPFASQHPFAESGPVYLHERECEPWARPGAWPDEFPRNEVVLRAYGTNEEIADARFVGRHAVEEVVAEMLANERVAFLHARNSTYGCFMFRVDRAS